MLYPRTMNLKNWDTSIFLFGPRMTGKTTLLKSLENAEYFDLLDVDAELRYKTTPKAFWDELRALPANSLIIVDEIQKAPKLLNYVQKAMDELGQRFILSGSSARKLKRGGANLLGGRALDMRLHPLTSTELGKDFSIRHALEFGTLPKICELLKNKQPELVRQHLKSYITTYIKEEIQAEALTRNVGAFHRFLTIAAQSNGQIIEFANISRECSVPMSTVKEYFQIIEDTLLGFFIWPWDRSERKKARPKFYFFDCGVVRALQNRLNDPPTPEEQGHLFETWFINEAIRMRDYGNKEQQFCFWRNQGNEVDIVVFSGRCPLLGIECKTGRREIKQSAANQFHQKFTGVPLITASLEAEKAKKSENIEILPWDKAIARYKLL